MSARRKNARRLKMLRAVGIPIDGSYRLTKDYGGSKAGARFDERTQKTLIAAANLIATPGPAEGAR